MGCCGHGSAIEEDMKGACYRVARPCTGHAGAESYESRYYQAKASSPEVQRDGP